MTRTDKKRHGAIEVADPDLSGTGIKIESALFVDLGLRIGGGENLDTDFWRKLEQDERGHVLSAVGSDPRDIYGLDAASCRNRALREDLSVRKELQRLVIDCSGHIAKGLPRLVPWSGFERPDQSVRQKFFRHRSFWCGPHE